MPTSARAAVLERPKHFALVDIEPPQPRAGEVTLRLQGCGVCASNIPPWEGRSWFQYPLPPGNPGHEAWGVVDQIGAGVDALRVGDRVAVLTDHAYATHDVAAAERVVPLPAALDGKPFPGEPLACAFNVLRRCAIVPGNRVAIVGIGFMGAVLTALCREAGAEVFAISRRTSSLSTAELMGAHHLVRMEIHDRIIAEIETLTRGELCDCVIECTGEQWPLDLAAELTRVRGRLVVAGYHQDGRRHVDMQLWNWRGLDVISAHERDASVYVEGLREAVDAVCRGRLEPTPLYTHAFALEDICAALEIASRRPEGFVKALLRYD